MAIDRQATGLTILRVCLGVFLPVRGHRQFCWFGNSSLLAGQLAGWLQTSGAAALNRDYLERFAIPYVAILARLVPLGEIASGLALIVGFWTPVFAFVAFVMAVNFNFASGAMLKYSFLTSGYGLPVLGSDAGIDIWRGAAAFELSRCSTTACQQNTAQLMADSTTVASMTVSDRGRP